VESNLGMGDFPPQKLNYIPTKMIKKPLPFDRTYIIHRVIGKSVHAKFPLNMKDGFIIVVVVE